MAFDPPGDKHHDAWKNRIHTMIDAMHNRDFFEFRGNEAWKPNCNLYETNDAYYLCVELAGIAQETIEVVSIQAGHLTIRGLRAVSRPQGAADPCSVHSMEIVDGGFQREIQIPAKFSAERIEITFDKGLVWIRLAKDARR